MKTSIPLYFLFFISIFLGCQKEYDETQIDLSNYHIEEGFQLKVVAAEPLIEAPIAMDFDEKGRLWVLELPGYMSNMNGDGENEPIGRILILEDLDGDGQMDHAKPFLEGLRAARAFAHAYGGILYAEPPNLFWVENKNDRPGKKIIVDSTYIVGGNIEHQPNSLTRNIDNWWYSAKSQFRYRKIGDTWKKEPTSFRGQWGMSKDDYGHLFYNDNSNPLYGDYIRPNLLLKNMHHRPTEGLGKIIAPDRMLYPLHATSVNRGYIEGMLDENGKIKTFTSACGPLIYRGHLFPSPYYGNAFVCAPEANLIKRYILKKKGNSISGENASLEKEFLASTDEAFRPVNLYNAPDGSMYVVDFHRGVIQHKVYMTAYLREKLLDKGLDSIVHYGRILKITSLKDSVENKINLSALNHEELIQLFFQKNGWLRDKAQQLIVEKNILEAIPNLKKIVAEGDNPLAQLHALWTLEGMRELDEETIMSACHSNHPELFSAGVFLLTRLKSQKKIPDLWNEKIKLKNDVMDLHLCFSASVHHNFSMLIQLLDRHKNDTLFYDAALSGLAGKEELFQEHLVNNIDLSIAGDFQKLLNKTIENKKEGIVFHQGTNTSTYTDGKTIGLELYRNHCASCHGMDGHGTPNLAPPIYHSEYIERTPNIMISLVLHGLKGPVTVDGKKYELNAVMPGLAVNPEMTDEKIAALLTFIRHGFGRDPLDISAEDVAAMRNVLPQEDLFTEAELMNQ